MSRLAPCARLIVVAYPYSQGKKGHVTVAELKHYLTGPFFGGAITPAQFDELIAHSGLSGNLSLQDFDTLFSTAPAIM